MKRKLIVLLMLVTPAFASVHATYHVAKAVSKSPKVAVKVAKTTGKASWFMARTIF